MRGRIRRAGAAAAVYAVCTALLAGCPGGKARTDNEDTGGDPRPLVVVGGSDLTSREGIGVRRELIEEWNERVRRQSDSGRPRREARLVELAHTNDEQRSQLIGALQSGTADYDVLILDIPWIPEFADSGLIQPLDNALVEDRGFLPQAVDAGRWKGHTYAVPFNTDVGLLYYREELHEQLETQDHSKLSTVLKGIARSRDGSFYTTQMAPYEGLTVNVLESFWSVDVHLVDGEGRYQGSESELREGLEEFWETVQRGTLHEGAKAADERTSLKAFVQGEAAMMRHWPYAFAQLDTQLPDEDGFRVQSLPGSATLGGQSLALAADSQRADDAQELIRFLTQESSQRKLHAAGFAAASKTPYQEVGECPKGHGRSAVARTERRKSDDEERPGTRWNKRSKRFRQAYDALVWCALERAEVRPATAHYVTFSRTVRREVRKLLDGQATVSETAEALHRQLAHTLDGRGGPRINQRD